MFYTQSMIEFCNVGKRFGRQWAVSKFTCTIQVAESIALFGGNGSGKSTLLRLIAAVSAPSTGTLQIMGNDVMRHRPAVRQWVRFLPHEKQLYGALTVMENLRLAARLRGVVNGCPMLHAAIERLQLTAVQDRKVAQLSEGMKKRVVLARLLLGSDESRIILLDEPHPALDIEGRRILQDLIGEWRRAKKTLILASHDHAEIVPHVDRVLVLRQGQLTYDGPPQSEKTAP